MADLRIAFAGDRIIGVRVLQYLLSQNVRPLALLLTERGKATHPDEIRALCPFLEERYVLWGRQAREAAGMALLRQLALDYILVTRFPYILPDSVLAIPRVGVLNLHPAYLPYNRGWHTPTWALLDNTPIGATLHFMDAGVDTGDIVHQKQLAVSPGDTAHTLYQRINQLELEVFQEAWPRIADGSYTRQPQDPQQGTAHQRKDLFAESVQRIDLDEMVAAGDLLRRLRALTTNRIEEAAYYEVDGRRYRVQVSIEAEE